MFRFFFGSNRGGTCRPVKNHVPGSKREMMSDITLKTLGSGDLIAAVRLPAGEDLNEWLAANTVDFYNELRLIWDIVTEIGVGNFQAGSGFPPGFEYRWAESKSSSPTVCSGPQYVELVLEWAEKELNNDQLFPTSSATPFPKTFITTVKQLFTRFFRIFAIIYSHHFSKLEQAGAVSHLNTSFKHLMLFIWEYDLVASSEFDALKDIIKEIRLRYGIEERPRQQEQSTPYSTCTYTKRHNAPEVYWINMDKSKKRRMNMQQHLDAIGFRHFRIRGVTADEIYIPPDIEKTWRTAQCQLQTQWEPPNKLSTNYFNSSNYTEYGSYTVYTSALCGRGKGRNTAKELGCTSSHLVAMYQAIYSTTATSRYALIIEDDVLFPFDIDFEELAKSAPTTGFGILQLFNSNEGTMESTWKMYVNNPEFLWAQKHAKKFFDYWSTCAYLIDRVTMKSVIDGVVNYQKSTGWIDLKIIAGINSPCVPKECCLPGTDDFIVKPPCVWAPRGYQADSFLYAMTPTYVLTIPIIANGLGGNQSTFHQDHVEMLHRKAFRRQREYVNLLYRKVAPPKFMKPACQELLDVTAI